MQVAVEGDLPVTAGQITSGDVAGLSAGGVNQLRNYTTLVPDGPEPQM